MDMYMISKKLYVCNVLVQMYVLIYLYILTYLCNIYIYISCRQKKLVVCSNIYMCNILAKGSLDSPIVLDL